MSIVSEGKGKNQEQYKIPQSSQPKETGTTDFLIKKDFCDRQNIRYGASLPENFLIDNFSNVSKYLNKGENFWKLTLIIHIPTAQTMSTSKKLNFWLKKSGKQNFSKFLAHFKVSTEQEVRFSHSSQPCVMKRVVEDLS